MLTQSEANHLIEIAKHFLHRPAAITIWAGTHESYELGSHNGGERFLLDVSRGKASLLKFTFQNRARIKVVLLRLDIGNTPHTNPDGSRVTGIHLHVYKEGYDDKWAEPLGPNSFSSAGEIGGIFKDFCGRCNIADPPIAKAVML